METGTRRMLGEILLERGVLSRAQLRLGLVHHHEVRVPLGRALIRERLCTENDVLQALSDQLGIGTVALERERLDPKLARLIPARIAQQYRVVPLRLEQRDREVLHIALPAPASIEALDAVRAISGKPRVEPHLASDTALSRALSGLYGLREPVPEPLESLLPAFDEAPLLLYGWPPVTAVLMSRVLSRHGFETRVVTPLEVLHAGPSDIVLAPMQAMEGLLMGEARLNGALIIHGDSDDEGFERAQALGARGFLANPLDEELLLRAIHRLRPPHASPPRKGRAHDTAEQDSAPS
ncbi:general secretion pathway protein GspE [Stigmatella sp. ncwal1]|uniref:General secretion pathway protein GspE n=1 Tax=Stigmatella ashevillensis TaxID=2995309 RepID=A0ABT5D2F3_9BACT|nr:general secretion pathway protein GspE [Stigmatella ashevillena]MDC0707850.1 general secretion pathway protein GspE [Stigmatella ashevillena]